MCGNIAKVRATVRIARNALTIVPDLEVVAAFAATADDRDIRSTGIDGVLYQFGDGLQRIRLRQRDDGDRVPVVPDAEFAPLIRAIARRWFLRHKMTGGFEVLSLKALVGNLRRLNRTFCLPTANWRLVWCPRRDSNPEPTDYESAALTVELQGHNNLLRYQTVVRIVTSGCRFCEFSRGKIF